MDDFVVSLTHVHSEIDTVNQWNRAIRSLTDMSNMEIAVAWLRLSKYALKNGNHDTLTDLKVIYKRALREYEQRETGESIHAKNHQKSSDFMLLRREIKELRFLVCSDDRTYAYRELDDQTSSGESLSTDSNQQRLPACVSPQQSVFAEADPSVAEHPLPTLNIEAMQRMIEQCCTKNHASVEKLQVVVEKINREIIDMKTNQITQTVLSDTLQPILTNSTQITGKITLELGELTRQMRLIDERLLQSDEKMQREFEKYTALAEVSQPQQVAALLETKLAEAMQSNTEVLKQTLAKEFMDQTTGILSHDASTTRVVEQVEGTLQAILHILGSRERSEQDLIQITTMALKDITNTVEETNTYTATMKAAIDENLKDCANSHKTALSRLSVSVLQVLETISEMMKTLISLQNKQTHRSANERPGAAGPIRSDREEDVAPMKQQDVSDPVVNTDGLEPSSRVHTVRKVQKRKPKTRPMTTTDNPLSEDPSNPGYISQSVQDGENRGKMIPPNPR